MSKFLATIEKFLSDHRMTETDFGCRVMNDGNFVSDLRAGRSPRMKTGDRVLEWMERHATENPPVPAYIAAPAPVGAIEMPVSP